MGHGGIFPPLPPNAREMANTEPTEVDRAADNLAKSGKGFGFPAGGSRRESMPQMAPRPYQEFGMARGFRALFEPHF